MPSAPRLAGGLAERLGGDTRLKVARYVRRMETFEALRERALDRFEAPGPIEPKGGVAYLVPLSRVASS